MQKNFQDLQKTFVFIFMRKLSRDRNCITFDAKTRIRFFCDKEREVEKGTDKERSADTQRELVTTLEFWTEVGQKEKRRDRMRDLWVGRKKKEDRKKIEEDRSKKERNTGETKETFEEEVSC